jgi:hypothetical protein
MKDGDGTLAGELAATLPGLDRAPERALLLARYMRLAHAALDAVPSAGMLAGRVTFPPADSMLRDLRSEHPQ